MLFKIFLVLLIDLFFADEWGGDGGGSYGGGGYDGGSYGGDYGYYGDGSGDGGGGFIFGMVFIGVIGVVVIIVVVVVCCSMKKNEVPVTNYSPPNGFLFSPNSPDIEQPGVIEQPSSPGAGTIRRLYGRHPYVFNHGFICNGCGGKFYRQTSVYHCESPMCAHIDLCTSCYSRRIEVKKHKHSHPVILYIPTGYPPSIPQQNPGQGQVSQQQLDDAEQGIVYEYEPAQAAAVPIPQSDDAYYTNNGQLNYPQSSAVLEYERPPAYDIPSYESYPVEVEAETEEVRSGTHHISPSFD